MTNKIIGSCSSYNILKNICGLTDSNLSHHLPVETCLNFSVWSDWYWEATSIVLLMQMYFRFSYLCIMHRCIFRDHVTINESFSPLFFLFPFPSLQSQNKSIMDFFKFKKKPNQPQTKCDFSENIFLLHCRNLKSNEILYLKLEKIWCIASAPLNLYLKCVLLFKMCLVSHYFSC